MPLILAYTPASIKKGTLDEITFSGMPTGQMQPAQ